jgi:ribonuclease J
MRRDIVKSGVCDGVFLYSLWSGYRDSEYQRLFEKALEYAGFLVESLHTSGHASVADIGRLIKGLDPQKIVPIHTMHPHAFSDLSDKTECKADGVPFEV